MRFLVFLLLALLVFAEEDPRKKTEEMLQQKIEQMRSFLDSLEKKYGVSANERLELCRRMRNEIMRIASPRFLKRGYIVFPNSDYAYVISENCDVMKLKITGSFSGNPSSYAEPFEKIAQVKEKKETEIKLSSLFAIIGFLLTAFVSLYLVVQVILSVLSANAPSFFLYLFLLIVNVSVMWLLLRLL